MTYAGTRTILDADSHVMELADFLDEFIEPDGTGGTSLALDPVSASRTHATANIGILFFGDFVLTARVFIVR